MAQREELIEAIKSYGFSVMRLLSSQREVTDILGRAQNRPPEGESDGSISEQEWTCVQKVHQSVQQLINDLKRANVEFGRRGE